MSERKDRAVGKAGTTAPATHSQPGEIDRFLGAAKQLAPLASGQAGRLVFALDATMSRQPTWDLACSLQARMFDVTSQSGGSPYSSFISGESASAAPRAGSASRRV